MDYILQMDVETFIEMLEIAMEKEQEELAHRQWSAMLPFMSLGMLEYVSFHEYFEKLSGKNVDLRPASEIIAEIEELHQKGGRAN